MDPVVVLYDATSVLTPYEVDDFWSSLALSQCLSKANLSYCSLFSKMSVKEVKWTVDLRK